MKTKKVSVALELDDQTLAKLDEVAASRSESRAHIIALACRRYVDFVERLKMDDEAYAEAYRRFPEEPAEGNVRFLAEMLADDEW